MRNGKDYKRLQSYDKNTPQSIQEMFSKVAPSYDRANAYLSFGLFRLWNRALVKALSPPLPEATLLDLCCGTGDIALAYHRHYPKTDLLLLDFCQKMLQEAKRKTAKSALPFRRLEFVEADVHSLPLPSESVHMASMAYGIRNVKDPMPCLKEVYRVLKEGGSFGILELTRPQNRFLQMGHSLYLRTLLPLLGKIVTSEESAYRYLSRSIHSFAAPAELAVMFQEVGFDRVECRPLMGGIATIIMGKKTN